MEQKGVVAVFLWRNADWRSPALILILFFCSFQPWFGRKRRIGNHKIECLQISRIVFILRVVERVALFDRCIGVVVKNHVHFRQPDCGIVFFLSVQGRIRGSFGFGAKKQRTGTACRVVDGGTDTVHLVEPQNLCDDTANLRWSIELTFAFSAFGCEILHQILIGIAYKIVISRAVFAEIEIWCLEYADKSA